MTDPYTRRSHPPAPATPARSIGNDIDIDIWLVHYRSIVEPALLNRLRTVLTPVERDKEGRFHFADDRLRYLVTRALVRDTLSRYAAIDPAAWQFRDSPFGRPEIANPDPACADLCFNISHTGGLIALAVTRGRALGIDVENVVARHSSPGIADRFFAPAEVAALEALPAALRHDRFFEYWTFKEAYIKARGMGLSLPLDRFAIHFPDANAVRLEVGFADETADELPGEFADDAARWYLCQMRPTPEHMLALCAERVGDAVPSLAVRTVAPAAHGPLFNS